MVVYFLLLFIFAALCCVHNSNAALMTKIPANPSNGDLVPGLFYNVAYGHEAQNVNYDTAPRVGTDGFSFGYANGLNTGNNFPGLDSDYSVEWTGYFLPDATGDWTFTAWADDYVTMWIGSAATNQADLSLTAAAIHVWYYQQEQSSSVYMVAGTYYPIRIQFSQSGGGQGLNWAFTSPNPGPSSRSDGTGYFFSPAAFAQNTDQPVFAPTLPPATPSIINPQGGLSYTVYNTPADPNNPLYFQSASLKYSDDNSHATGISTDLSNVWIGTGNGFTFSEYYSVIWTGYFYAPVSGVYTLSVSAADDYALVWFGEAASDVSFLTLGNALVFNPQPVQIFKKVTLTAGTYYPIRIQYSQACCGQSFGFGFTAPGGSPTTNGLGYYFHSSTAQPSALPTTPAPSAAPSTDYPTFVGERKCPMSYTYYPQVHKCYRVHLVRVTWYAANLLCSSKHKRGHLLSVTSAADEAFLTETVLKRHNTTFWIGLNRVDNPYGTSLQWYLLGARAVRDNGYRGVALDTTLPQGAGSDYNCVAWKFEGNVDGHWQLRSCSNQPSPMDTYVDGFVCHYDVL